MSSRMLSCLALLTFSMIPLGCGKSVNEVQTQTVARQEPHLIRFEQPSSVNPLREQHVLVATVVDSAGQPVPGQTVEWTLTEESVGAIVDFHGRGNGNGRRLGHRMVITRTLASSTTLPKQLTGKDEDIHINPGQTWVVLTSAAEGVSHVIAFAPEVADWRRHKAFFEKYWSETRIEVDEQATNLVGDAHTIRARVLQADPRGERWKPLEGARVSFEIISGPDGSLQPASPVQTDAEGYASVTLRQTEPSEGANLVRVSLEAEQGSDPCCRGRADLPPALHRKHWRRLSLEKSAPPQAEVWQEFEYTITVRNPLDRPLQGVVITDALPEGIESAENPAQRVLRFDLGTLSAGQEETLSLAVRARERGNWENCAEVEAAGRQRGRACANTRVTGPELEIVKTAPSEAMCFELQSQLVVRNTGDAAAVDVRVEDLFGPVGGEKTKVFEEEIGTLEPGQAWRRTVPIDEYPPGGYTNLGRATGRARYCEDPQDRLVAEQQVDITVVAPQLEATSQTIAEGLAVGGLFGVALEVTNVGSALAQDFELQFPLQPILEVASVSAGRWRVERGKVIWSDFDPLPVGASTSLRLQFRLLECGLDPSGLEFRVYALQIVAGQEQWRTPVPVLVAVPPPPDVPCVPAIAAEKRVTEDELGCLAFEIRAQNQGNIKLDWWEITRDEIETGEGDQVEASFLVGEEQTARPPLRFDEEVEVGEWTDWKLLALESLKSEYQGSLFNQVFVRAEAERNGRQYSAEDETRIPFEYDARLEVEVTSQASRQSIPAGDEVELEVRVTNEGNLSERLQWVEVSLPSLTNQDVCWPSESDEECRSGPDSWKWEPQVPLPPGESWTGSVTLRWSDDISGTLRIEASAKSTCAAGKATLDLDSTVSALLLEVVDQPDPVEIGQSITYTVTTTNQGEDEDSEFEWKILIPEGMDLAEGREQIDLRRRPSTQGATQPSETLMLIRCPDQEAEPGFSKYCVQTSRSLPGGNSFEFSIVLTVTRAFSQFFEVRVTSAATRAVGEDLEGKDTEPTRLQRKVPGGR